MSLSDLPLLYEIIGGSLYISLSKGWFCKSWLTLLWLYCATWCPIVYYERVNLYWLGTSGKRIFKLDTSVVISHLEMRSAPNSRNKRHLCLKGNVFMAELCHLMPPSYKTWEKWCSSLIDAIIEGNRVHDFDFVYAGAPINLDVEDVADTFGADIHVQAVDDTEYFVVNNNYST